MMFTANQVRRDAASKVAVRSQLSVATTAVQQSALLHRARVSVRHMELTTPIDRLRAVACDWASILSIHLCMSLWKDRRGTVLCLLH